MNDDRPILTSFWILQSEKNVTDEELNEELNEGLDESSDNSNDSSDESSDEEVLVIPKETTILKATKRALIELSIKNRDDLDDKKGPTKSGLYDKVKELVDPTVWNKIQDPKASIRSRYEKILPGYRYFS